jgi:D-alanyl-D-alanine carboxypeptidase
MKASRFRTDGANATWKKASELDVPGIGSLIPQMQPYATELLRVAGQARLAPRITSARRSTALQARLYRNYLAGAATYPVAPPGTSSHEFGFAFDMVTSPLEALSELGVLWESWGGVWGGRFQDPVHFEYPGFSSPRPTAQSAPSGPVTNAENWAIGFADFWGLPVPTRFAKLARYAATHPNASFTEQVSQAFQILVQGK